MRAFSLGAVGDTYTVCTTSLMLSPVGLCQCMQLCQQDFSDILKKWGPVICF